MLVEEAINLAIQHEQAGRLTEAEGICRSIIEQHPSAAAAWNLLGMIAARRGQMDAAVAHVTRAIEGDPNSALLHANLGELNRRQNRIDEALAALRKAVELDPSSAIIWNKLGITLRAGRRVNESLQAFDRAIALDAGYADPHNNRGNSLRDLGRVEEAVEEYRRAVGLKPNLAEAHANLGNVLSDRGEFESAVASYQTALRLQPNYPEAFNNLATALRRAKRFDEALVAVREALRLRSNYGEAFNTLGSIYYDMGQTSQAIAAYEDAVEIEPKNFMIRNNLAMALEAAGEFDKAVDTARSAVQMNPQYAEGFNTLANLLADSGRYDEAAAAFGRAIELKPDFALAHWNYSLIPLLRGDFQTGWAEHEWRSKTNVASRPRGFAQPMWDGRKLNGERILIHQEQGFGDMIQFIRYAPMVAERGGRVIVSCAGPLERLFAEMPGITVARSGDPLPEFDLQIPILSLPAVFETTLDSIPALVPYLKAPAETAQRWQELLGARDGKLRVGLTWSGNPQRKLDQRRSISAELLLPLAKLEGVRLYSLQKDGADNSAAPAGLGLIDFSAELRDFAETAGMIENLDLVISVDTAVAHLAGALGKPVSVLLGYVPAWRWMLDRTDSPWYPTMRLFRQPAMGDWAGPINQVVEALGERAAGKVR